MSIILAILSMIMLDMMFAMMLRTCMIAGAWHGYKRKKALLEHFALMRNGNS